jgi:hypothetical protein
MAWLGQRIRFGNSGRYVFAGATARENLPVGDKLIQRGLVQVAALGLVNRRLVRDESDIRQLLQNDAVGAGDATRGVGVFNAYQPLAIAGFGV